MEWSGAGAEEVTLEVDLNDKEAARGRRKNILAEGRASAEA